MRLGHAGTATAAFFFLASSLFAEDIYVNALNTTNPETGKDCAHGYKSLQDGIDKAGRGDRVIVCVATYEKNVKIQYKTELTVISEPHATGVIPSTCPPVCRGLPTLTRAQGATDPVLSILDSSRITIRGFLITGGDAEFGGGIKIRNTPQVLIEANCIYYNHAQRNGGGCQVETSERVVFLNNHFLGNTSERSGGGLHVMECYPHETFLDCNHFQSNSADNGAGGGVYCVTSRLKMKKNVFFENVAIGFETTQPEEPEVERGIPSFHFGTRPRGGALAVDSKSALVYSESDLFRANQSRSDGGAVAARFAADLHFGKGSADRKTEHRVWL